MPSQATASAAALAAAAAAVATYLYACRAAKKRCNATDEKKSSTIDPLVTAWRSLPEPAIEIDETARAQIIAGLQRTPRARVSQEFLYDDEGSKLYEGITRTPEYYLTSKEAALLAECADDIGRSPQPSTTGAAPPLPTTQVAIELGAGEGIKTLLLLRALVPHAPRTVYAPIDISAEALESNKETVAHLKLETRPCHGKFEECLPKASARAVTSLNSSRRTSCG